MRKCLFCLFVFLAGCNGNDDDGLAGSAAPPVAHVPEIRTVTLSQPTATYMEGDGDVSVTAEISFWDTGLDVQTLSVRLPDGTSMDFSESVATPTGTITEVLAMPTTEIGDFSVEVWLEDEAGNSSLHRSVDYRVIWNSKPSDWTQRISGLPYALTDVIWDGTAFIAVGGAGTILTSPDGIDWVARDSGTDAGLMAVAVYGPDIIAIGDEIVLLSTDHGLHWVIKDQPAGVALSTIAMNASQVVVGGHMPATLEPSIMISADRGDTWQTVDALPDDFFFLTDFIYQDGLFVATIDSLFSVDGGWIYVSADGEVWTEIYRSNSFGLNTVIHAGDRFVVAGRGGAVFSSFDGFNWTLTQTPVQGVDYLSAAWNGSKLILAGGYVCWNWEQCSPPDPELPYGIATSDNGTTWEPFGIDGSYQSLGLAFGNGRFVSVGQSAPLSGEGAIYTAD